MPLELGCECIIMMWLLIEVAAYILKSKFLKAKKWDTELPIMDAFWKAKTEGRKIHKRALVVGGIQQGPGGTTQEKKIMLKLF